MDIGVEVNDLFFELLLFVVVEYFTFICTIYCDLIFDDEGDT